MRRRSLPFQIAFRYLTAPKSHGAVSAISIISVVGVAVATAAIVIVLSVFNGFRYELNERLDTLIADITVVPSEGKTFAEADSIAEIIGSIPNVEIAMPVMADNALVVVNDREMPVSLKGVVPTTYSRITGIDSLIFEGVPVKDFFEKEAAISIGVASQLQIYVPETAMLLFAPRRKGKINPANPMSSLISDSLYVKSIFRSLQADTDENTIITDIATVRELFLYDTEATSIEVKAKKDTDLGKLSKTLAANLGENFMVKDRLQQQEVNFRMVAIEKWITFLLLSFILVIASFNIISTIAMLIVDKESSLHTLARVGMNKVKIGNIFQWESLLVTLCGAIIGIAFGVVLSLLQQHFGIIKIAGNPETLVIDTYPVRVQWLDLLVTFIPILLIGLITSLISYHFARNKVAASF